MTSESSVAAAAPTILLSTSAAAREKTAQYNTETPPLAGEVLDRARRAAEGMRIDDQTLCGAPSVHVDVPLV